MFYTLAASSRTCNLSKRDITRTRCDTQTLARMSRVVRARGARPVRTRKRESVRERDRENEIGGGEGGDAGFGRKFSPCPCFTVEEPAPAKGRGMSGASRAQNCLPSASSDCLQIASLPFTGFTHDGLHTYARVLVRWRGIARDTRAKFFGLFALSKSAVVRHDLKRSDSSCVEIYA